MCTEKISAAGKLISRIKSPTPKKWKKIGKLFIGVAAIGATILAFPMGAPIWVGAAFAGIGAFGRMITSLATEEKTENYDTEEIITGDNEQTL